MSKSRKRSIESKEGKYCIGRGEVGREGISEKNKRTGEQDEQTKKEERGGEGEGISRVKR
jgi:hypothetical protein